MTRKTVVLEAIERYVHGVFSKETPVQQRLRAETARMPHGAMQIGPDQGALLALLARLAGRGGRWRSACSPATAPWRSRPRCRRTVN